MTDAEHTPRRHRKGLAREQEILRVATEHFATSGFRGASLREIAAACGIAHSSLLRYFPSKEALLVAVLARWDRTEASDFYVPEDRSGPQILSGLVALAEQNANARGVVDLTTTLGAEAVDPEHPAHAYVTDRLERMRLVVADALRRAEAAGELRADVDIADAAAGIVALVEGVPLQWLYAPGTIDMAGALATMIQALLLVPLPEWRPRD